MEKTTYKQREKKKKIWIEYLFAEEKKEEKRFLEYLFAERKRKRKDDVA